MDSAFEDENHMKLIKVTQINGADSRHTSARHLLDVCFFIHVIFSTIPQLQYLEDVFICLIHIPGLKGIVHTKMKTKLLNQYSRSGHPRCRWVGFFLRTDLEKCITSLAHQLILCSEWVPSEWESKQLIKHHNNPHHSSPSVNVLWSEKWCIYAWNKSIIKTI